MTTSDTFLSEQSTVTTAASQADGGNITVTAPTLVRLRDSRLTASVGGGPQTVGGNITIGSQFVLLENSQVSANAFAGRGGNVQITAEVFLADPASQVSASSALGITGAVDIRAPVTTLSGVVAPLPLAFASAAAVLRDPCATRLRTGHISSLVVAGRDGVPPEPEGGLPSPLAWATLEASPPAETLRPSPAPRVLWPGDFNVPLTANSRSGTGPCRPSPDPRRR
jgi:large exoprotein involved in heme utilization and adhesion